MIYWQWFGKFGVSVMDKNRNNDTAGFFRALALVGQVGFYIALPMVLGAFLGQFLDNRIHDSAPLATIFGLLLGLAAGVALVVRAIIRMPPN
jgi:F0F1-type ATP synthase assembly protein I